MPKIPFVEYDRLVKSRVLAMLPSSDLLKIALIHEKSERTLSNVEAGKSILIELFSRSKKEDILNQIAYLEKGDIALFTHALSIPLFVAQLKKIMQSPRSNLKHRERILDAWMGISKTEATAHSLEEIQKKIEQLASMEDFEKFIIEVPPSISISTLMSLTKSSTNVSLDEEQKSFQKLSSTERSKYLNALVSNQHEVLSSETLPKNLLLFKSITKLLPEMSDSEIKHFADFLLTRLKEGKNIHHILEVFAIIIPRMNDSELHEITPELASYLTHDNQSICHQAVLPIKILIPKLKKETVEEFIIQPLIDCFNHQKVRQHFLCKVTDIIKKIFKTEPVYAPKFIEPMLNILKNSDQRTYENALDIFTTMTFSSAEYRQIIDALFTKFKLVNYSEELDGAISTLLPHMVKPEITLYIKYILEKINTHDNQTITYFGWNAANTLIPLLSDSADIQQFLQPILGALGNQTDAQTKRDAWQVWNAASSLIPLLSDSVDIQQFIQPILNALGNQNDAQTKKYARDVANRLIPRLSNSVDRQQLIKPILDALDHPTDMQMKTTAWSDVNSLIPLLSHSADIQLVIQSILGAIGNQNDAQTKVAAWNTVNRFISLLSDSAYIQQFIPFILGALGNQNDAQTKAAAWNTVNILIPLLSNPADIERFIQPILSGLDNQSSREIKEAARQAANRLMPLLSNSADIEPFIQPVLSASRTIDGEVEAGILLATVKEPFTERPIRLNHALDTNEANVLSYLIINNKASEQFKLALNDVSKPDSLICALQRLQQQWTSITAKEQAQHHKQTLNQMKQSEEGVEHNNKMKGNP